MTLLRSSRPVQSRLSAATRQRCLSTVAVRGDPKKGLLVASPTASFRLMSTMAQTATSPPTLSLASLSNREELFANKNNENKLLAPRYDPSLLSAGIVHVGLGNFHKSHLSAYMNDLFNRNSNCADTQQWGIVGAGMMSFDADKRALLQGQDYLQTLVEQDGTSSQASVLASMIDFLPVDHEQQRHSELQETLSCNPAIKIVSLTVTEGGYFLTSQGNLDKQHGLIQHDIQRPEEPKTIFGIMVKALRHRYATGMAPFTIMSCDNIPHNGNVVKNVVLGLAQAQRKAQELDKDSHGNDDKNFLDWLQNKVTYPNSMVDRITAGTTSAMRDHVEMTYGYQDAAPVFAEPFRQWVLEDKFCAGRPSWETLNYDDEDNNNNNSVPNLTNAANISFVEDVAPYELMKIRILNGGHASLCYPAALLDVEYVHEAAGHPTIGPFLEALEEKEIIPTLPPVPDTDLMDYWNLIRDRFSNPTIRDTVQRICYDGASRQPKFIVPVAADALMSGSNCNNKQVNGLAMVSALWCRYCQGTTESGKAISPNDPQWDRLHALAQRATAATGSQSPSSVWLTGLPDIYGDTVGTSPVFAAAFDKAMLLIQSQGVEAALKDYTATAKQSSDSIHANRAA